MIPYLRRPEHAEPRLLEALLSTGVVVGFKDGLRDPLGFRRLRAPARARSRSRRRGRTRHSAYWAYGVDAVSPASATHDPAYARRWIDALADARACDEARRLLDLFGHPFSDLRRSRPGIDVACVKYALSLRGHCTADDAGPTATLTAAEQARDRSPARRDRRRVRAGQRSRSS